jgi:long-subunit fatty acid transport protein
VRSGRDENAYIEEFDDELGEYVALFDGPGFLTDSHTREGKLTAWSGAIAWDISPRFSAGLTLSYLNGSILDEQTFLTEDADDIDDYYTSLQSSVLLDLDISGYSAMGGLLYQASPSVRFGAVVGTPRVLDFERFEQVQIRDFRDDGLEDFESTSDILADETVTFPWFFGFGISWAARGLMLAGDVRYTDWSELKDEVGDVEEFLVPYYEEETSLSLGGEYLFPRWPLRVRAGYRYEPVSFNLTYCPFYECAPVGRDPAELDVAVDRDRHVYSFGAGYLFGSVFALYAAFETGYYERRIESDPDLYSEKRTAGSFVLTGAYRF